MDQTFPDHSRRKMTLLIIQLILSMTSATLFLWELVTFAKRSFLGKPDFNTWAYIFFRPVESSLLNYVVTAAFLGICALGFYMRGITEYMRNRSGDVGYTPLVASLALSLCGLMICTVSSTMPRPVLYAVISVIPLILFLTAPSKPVRNPLIRRLSDAVPAFSYLILFVLLLEPFLLMSGPVHLMNEYQDLYGETRIKNGYVNNKEFLDRLSKTTYDFALLQELRNQYKATKTRSTVLAFLKREDLRPIEAYRDLERRVNHPSTIEWGGKGGEKTEQRDPNVYVEDAKDFYLYNRIEYQHQNMARGQINHIGHILNPLNEYQLGRPLGQTYVQYGIGNTFLMKWIMDLYGGISFQAFYKCYVFYLIYALLFFIMLNMVFRDRLFVLGSFMVYAFAFFWTGFMGFVLAPGIIPSGHMLDVVVAILLVLYFQQKKVLFLILAALASVLALLLSFQFGGILSLAFVLTMVFFLLEKNISGKRTLFAAAIIVAMLASEFALFRLVSAGKSADGFRYFLLGYFSWEPDRLIVTVTILFLIVSYIFMIFLRNSKEPIKYVYIFSLMYSQGLFVYYYWSGLLNHLPMVLPFIGLHFFLMLFVAHSVLFREREEARKKVRGWVKGITLPVAFLTLASAAGYYAGKQDFYSNFSNHRVYQWQFPRATVTTTIDPSPIKEAVSLISNYARADKAIFVVSKYDNLLPFLASKYSRMPQFELAYALISQGKTIDAVESIQKNKPRFLFVDTNIDLKEEPFDPWNGLFFSAFDRNERASRYGRLLELKKVFDGVKGDYKRIAEGRLLSVYERIQ